MQNYKFNPDLIVEVTSVCDRACKGCYAQNQVSTMSKEDLYAKFPSLFIDLPDLQAEINALPEVPETVSFRGGEPTRHPELDKIIKLTRSLGVKRLYLETHGRWLLNDSDEELLEALKLSGAIVKISFDKMHQVSAATLRKMTDKLKDLGIDFRIAITEIDQATMMQTKALCPWLSDTHFIYQLKAVHISELPKPRFGVLGCSGARTDGLNVKESFQ